MHFQPWTLFRGGGTRESDGFVFICIYCQAFSLLKYFLVIGLPFVYFCIYWSDCLFSGSFVSVCSDLSFSRMMNFPRRLFFKEKPDFLQMESNLWKWNLNLRRKLVFTHGNVNASPASELFPFDLIASSLLHTSIWSFVDRKLLFNAASWYLATFFSTK